MKMQTLRSRLMKLGQCAILLGIIVSVSGICLGNLIIIGLGCVTFFGGAYAMIFAKVGSF